MFSGPPSHRERIRFGDSDDAAIEAPPLRIGVIGDFASQAAAERSAPIRIDKDNFNDALRALCPALSFHVPDRTSSGSGFINVGFAVQDLRSFHPMNLCRAEAFRGLLRDRSMVLDLRDGRISIDDFRRQARAGSALSGGTLLRPGTETAPGASQPAPRPERPVKVQREQVLDSILDMVESPPGSPRGEAETEGAARVQAFLSEMFARTRPAAAVNRAEADRAVREIDGILSRRLNDVLGSPEVRRLESGWRGLKFLVDRTEFRDPIRIELVSAPKDQLPAVLESIAADAVGIQHGPDVILADFEFENTPEDQSVLRRAGELAMELKAPLLAGIGAAFFGKADLEEVVRIPLLRSYMESEGFVKWNGFRGSEASRWVALALNRFLLRNRYGEGSARTPFAFEEEGDGLWGNPIWAVGTLVARSFSLTGWCGHITGLRGGGLIEDLPVRPVAEAPGDVRHLPLQAAFRTGREGDYFDAGFLALQCGEDQDAALLLEAPTARLPERYPDPGESERARRRTRLTYQLVAGRIARRIEVLLGQLSGQSPEELREELQRSLTRWIGPAPAGREPVQVQLTGSRERAGRLDLAIRVLPGPPVWPLEIPIEMQVTLPGA